MFKIFCNNYKTGHVATTCQFILSKLKLCLYQRCSLLDQFCLSPKKIIRLIVYLTLSLGVTLGNKLCWSTHIKSVTANFNAKLNKLKQMKTFDHTTLETILKIPKQTLYFINTMQKGVIKRNISSTK